MSITFAGKGDCRLTAESDELTNVIRDLAFIPIGTLLVDQLSLIHHQNDFAIDSLYEKIFRLRTINTMYQE